MMLALMSHSATSIRSTTGRSSMRPSQNRLLRRGTRHGSQRGDRSPRAAFHPCSDRKPRRWASSSGERGRSILEPLTFEDDHRPTGSALPSSHLLPLPTVRLIAERGGIRSPTRRRGLTPPSPMSKDRSLRTALLLTGALAAIVRVGYWAVFTSDRALTSDAPSTSTWHATWPRAAATSTRSPGRSCTKRPSVRRGTRDCSASPTGCCGPPTASPTG